MAMFFTPGRPEREQIGCYLLQQKVLEWFNIFKKICDVQWLLILPFCIMQKINWFLHRYCKAYQMLKQLGIYAWGFNSYGTCSNNYVFIRLKKTWDCKHWNVNILYLLVWYVPPFHLINYIITASLYHHHHCSTYHHIGIL